PTRRLSFPLPPLPTHLPLPPSSRREASPAETRLSNRKRYPATTLRAFSSTPAPPPPAGRQAPLSHLSTSAGVGGELHKRPGWPESEPIFSALRYAPFHRGGE